MESNNANGISINIPNLGPLDILLDLAKTQKVDLKISITKLADQFLNL